MSKFNYDSPVVQENLERVSDMVTLSIYNESKEWYPKAHEKAVEFSKIYNKTIDVTAALISVFSPQKAWHQNLLLAEEYLKNGRARHTSTQVRKADGIVCFKDLSIEFMLGGLKTINFYHNILDPKDDRYCTIDSHMYQLMTGNMDVKKMTTKHYNFLKGELISFAKKNNRLPSEQQAELWLIFKANKFNKL